MACNLWDLNTNECWGNSSCWGRQVLIFSPPNRYVFGVLLLLVSSGCCVILTCLCYEADASGDGIISLRSEYLVRNINIFWGHIIFKSRVFRLVVLNWMCPNDVYIVWDLSMLMLNMNFYWGLLDFVGRFSFYSLFFRVATDWASAVPFRKMPIIWYFE